MRHIKGTPSLTVHQRIVMAAVNGKGVRLSASEVEELLYDDAISTAARDQSARLQNCTAWSAGSGSYEPGDEPEDTTPSWRW